MAIQFLSRWGVIGVSGDDAVTFLQGQLSNDIAGMGNHQLRMAGLCTAKGRLLGSFFVFRQGPQVYLVCRKEIVPALVKRLTMFVLRSKCKVQDLTDSHPLVFLPNAAADAPMQVQWSDDGSAQASLRPLNTQLPGLALLTNANAPTGLDANNANDDAFEHVLQQLGIAFVSQPTVEMFIPQAINFDLVGGVSFSKGCYPGQEVVARSHYLGKVKRRAYLAETKTGHVVPAGQDVWLNGKDNEPVGAVITSVSVAESQKLLIELPVEEAAQQGSEFVVKVGSESVPLTIQSPPYDVLQKGNVYDTL